MFDSTLKVPEGRAELSWRWYFPLDSDRITAFRGQLLWLCVQAGNLSKQNFSAEVIGILLEYLGFPAILYLGKWF